MYIGTVLLFVQELLATTLNGVIASESIQITPNEEPWATSGELTITIHPMGWDTGEVKLYQGAHGERVPFGVTVIRRTRRVPKDRWGSDLFLQATDSLTTITSIINKILNKKSNSNIVLTNKYIDRVTNLITNNTLKDILLPTGKSISIVSQFEWLDTQGEPVERMPDFFREKPLSKTIDDDLIAGHSITSSFLSPTLLQAITCPS
jgi:hypothetical protein